LAGYEVSFGIIGIIIAVGYFARAVLKSLVAPDHALEMSFLLTTGLDCLFYIVAIVAGVLLSHRKQSGKTLSILIHAMQVPVFTLWGISHLVSLSGTGWVGFISSTEHATTYAFTHVSASPQFFVNHPLAFIYDPVGASVVGVDVVAIVLLVLFMRVRIAGGARPSRYPVQAGAT
jgi:hypothetical protein